MSAIAPKLGHRIDQVLARLYADDHEQRRLGLSTPQRTRNIDIESGRFLFALALGMQATVVLEIGSSNGVSTIWLAAAAQRTGGFVHGADIRLDRVTDANRNLEAAGLAEFAHVHHVTPDGQLPVNESVDLVFIDAEKEDYSDHFERSIGYVRPGGLILADNVISHDCSAYQEHVRSRPDIETLTLPLDRGFEFSVKI